MEFCYSDPTTDNHMINTKERWELNFEDAPLSYYSLDIPESHKVLQVAASSSKRPDGPLAFNPSSKLVFVFCNVPNSGFVYIVMAVDGSTDR